MKNWYFSLKDSEGGVSQRLKYKKKQTEHLEIKHSEITKLNSKCKGILNKFEKGEVLRWSL